MQFWAAPELGSYLSEGLQTWNALTSFWRADMTFPLLGYQNPATPTWWYDLTQQTGTPRPFTATDAMLLGQIAYHLLEPVTGGYPLVWRGSNQFALSDLMTALQRRRDECLALSGCTVTRTAFPALFVARQTLPDNVIDIRRVAWIPTQTGSGYTLSVLRQADNLSKWAYDQSYTTAPQKPPRNWMKSAQPPLAFDIDYIPPVPSQFEVLTVNAGPALSTSAATLLGIPDDWAWVAKWGALASLLGRESSAKDVMRAAYAKQRFDQGIALMLNSPAVLASRLNNLPCFFDSVRNGDDFGGWQRSTSTTPRGVYLAGLNLLAIAPAPLTSNTYSAGLSVVSNAPLPQAPGDYLQIAREDYGSLLDYAQHLALFKVGGAEFEASVPLLRDFMKRAAFYNSKLSALGLYPKTQIEASQLEQERNPVFGELVPGGEG